MTTKYFFFLNRAQIKTQFFVLHAQVRHGKSPALPLTPSHEDKFRTETWYCLTLHKPVLGTTDRVWSVPMKVPHTFSGYTQRHPCR